jgi:hypothetical protein
VFTPNLYTEALIPNVTVFSIMLYKVNFMCQPEWIRSFSLKYTLINVRSYSNMAGVLPEKVRNPRDTHTQREDYVRMQGECAIFNPCSETQEKPDLLTH